MKTIEDTFNLRDYMDHESEFVAQCHNAQLEATPTMSRTEFILNHYIARGYADQYLDYYLGRKHKPVYEVKR